MIPPPPPISYLSSGKPVELGGGKGFSSQAATLCITEQCAETESWFVTEKEVQSLFVFIQNASFLFTFCFVIEANQIENKDFICEIFTCDFFFFLTMPSALALYIKQNTGLKNLLCGNCSTVLIMLMTLSKPDRAE